MSTSFKGKVEETGHKIAEGASEMGHKVGEKITIKYQRDAEHHGPIRETETTIKSRPEKLQDANNGPGPFLGVGATVPAKTFGLLDSVGRSVTGTGEVTWQSLVAMGQFFSPTGIGDYAETVGNGSDSPSEPTPGRHVSSSGDNGGDNGRMLSILGVLQLGSDAGKQGLANLLPIFLMINVFVGMINLVPLLPFDGGHAAVAVYERIRSRGGRRYHADVSKLLPVAYAVVMGLVILGVTSLYLDIVNPI